MGRKKGKVREYTSYEMLDELNFLQIGQKMKKL